MKWNDTVASGCRYGEIASALFQGSEVIWEDSYDDYQGHAKVLVEMRDHYGNGHGVFVHYEWTYGSCSGCDYWEDQGLSNAEILRDMSREAIWLQTRDEADAYIQQLNRPDMIAAWEKHCDGLQ